MKTAMLFAVLLVACCANAQSSKFSLAFTSASAGSPCQTEPLDPDALCPNQEWIVTDASGTVTDYNGSEGSQAHDEFGALKVRGTAVVTAHFTSAAGAAQSGAGADASFADTLTFAGLNGPGPYFLVMNMTVLGDVGGGFLQGVSSVELGATADIVNVTSPSNVSTQPCARGSSNMLQGSFRDSCTSKLQISATDIVTFSARLFLGVSAVVPDHTGSITQNPQADFFSGKNSGLNFTLQIVDAKGRKVNKAQIIAASGTDYPTH